MSKFNLDNFNQQLIVSGIVGLVEDEGLSPHEAFKLVDEIKHQIFHALVELSSKRKDG